MHAEILAEAAAAGGLPFPRFLERALYDAQGGYYASAATRVGRAGDFFTSVSVGPLFGELLARRFLRWRRETGTSGRWRILETGANDGALAADILEAIARLDASACEALEYVIAEPLDAPREAQADRLAGRPGWSRHVRSPADLAGSPLPGIAFGNELLDALPFHLVVLRAGCWHETGVAAAERGALEWCDLGPVHDDALAAALAKIDVSRLPGGYRTEVRTNFEALHRGIAAAFTRLLVVWIDYGFARPEYYDPARTTGTLRTYARHCAGENPLDSPGTADITAHVDFTAVAEDAAAAGLALAGFSSQGAWLTREARDWLMECEGRPPAPAAVRQFQTLTHPAQLGAKFHVIELANGPPTATPADLHRCGLSQ